MSKKEIQKETIDAALEIYATGVKASVVAERFAMTEQAFAYHAKKRGVWNPKQVTRSSGFRAAALASYSTGKSFVEVGKDFGVSDAIVRIWAKKAGVCRSNDTVKYTNEQREAVKTFRKEGVSLEEIEIKTGVKYGIVRAIVDEAQIRLTKKQLKENRRVADDETDVRIVQLRKDGIDIKSIATEVGQKFSYVRMVLTAAGIVIDQGTATRNLQIAKASFYRDVHKTFLEIVAKRGGKLLSEYIGCRHYVSIKCSKGHTFSVKPQFVTSKNTWCARCAKRGPSQTQIQIYEFIKSVTDEEVILSDRKAINPKELDIYLPARRLGIEFNGLYWHGERWHSDKFHAYRKYLQCEAVGIRLITIFGDEWTENEEVVKGFLRAVLGCKQTRVGARECDIVKQNCEAFFDASHLQGSVQGEHLALINDGEVVAAMAVRRPNASKTSRSDTPGGVWEVSRYATRDGVSVPGGFSKLLKAFLRETQSCTEVITYSDNRWSQGAMYKAAGFTMELESRPSFSYVPNKGTNRVSRFTYRKSEALRLYGGAPEDTEWDIMKRNGWDRVWDCGKKRWNYKVNRIT